MSQPRALSPLGVVLAISLIANALLLGLWIGNAMGKGKPPHDRGPRGGGEEAVIARALESILPEGSRQEMRSAFREGFRKAAPYMLQKRQARQELKAALGAEPFDPAAVEAAFDRILEADQRLTRSFHGVLAEELSSLTQTQRNELVAWMDELEATRREWRSHRKDRGDRPDGRGGPPPPGEGPPD